MRDEVAQIFGFDEPQVLGVLTGREDVVVGIYLKQKSALKPISEMPLDLFLQRYEDKEKS